jgi:cyclic pyranopterin phosphate synthase
VYVRFPKLKEPIGLIRAVHHKFCSTCNRVRLTSEGRLKLCLCYDTGLDLRELLRNQTSDTEIREQFQQAVYQKPAQHCFLSKEQITETNSMAKIGG